MTLTASPASWLGWLTADPRRKDLAVAVGVLIVSAALIGGGPDDIDTGWPEVVAGVGAFVLVLFRRRWPLPLLLVSLAWSAIHTVVWERPSPLLFATLVLLATVCVRLERGPAIGLGVVVGVVLFAVVLVVNDDRAVGDERSVIALVWTAAAVGVADAARTWRRYQASVDAELRSAVEAAEARSRQQVTEERLRIARELHDLLAHNLSVMNVQTAAAQHLVRSDPGQAEEALTAARDAGRTVLDELRELLAVLREDGADDPPRDALPTLDDLPALVETMRAAGLDVSWTDGGQPLDPTPAVSLAAYRIVQEALTNAARHGDGRATLVTEWDDHRLTITVTNPHRGDGATTNEPSTGHGLLGMRERATTNGGTLEAGPTAAGFEVRAVLPVAPTPTEARS